MSRQWIAGQSVEMSPGALMAALGAERNFAQVKAAKADRVELRFDLDPQRWAFLQLPSDHPIVIEEFGYFAAVTASWAIGLMEPGQHSALTRMEWRNQPARFDGEHACSGTARFQPDDISHFELFGADGRKTADLRNRGFIFAPGDFEAARAAAKARLAAARIKASAFCFAATDAVGLTGDRPSFVGAPRGRDPGPRVAALVTRDDFYPQHPDIEGSGDHVNAAHLLECCMQAAHLMMRPQGRLRCHGGSAEFRRFVELDVPFDIAVAAPAQAGRAVSDAEFTIQQADRTNAVIRLKLAIDHASDQALPG